MIDRYGIDQRDSYYDHDRLLAHGWVHDGIRERGSQVIQLWEHPEIWVAGRAPTPLALYVDGRAERRDAVASAAAAAQPTSGEEAAD